MPVRFIPFVSNRGNCPGPVYYFLGLEFLIDVFTDFCLFVGDSRQFTPPPRPKRGRDGERERGGGGEGERESTRKRKKEKDLQFFFNFFLAVQPLFQHTLAYLHPDIVALPTVTYIRDMYKPLLIQITQAMDIDLIRSDYPRCCALHSAMFNCNVDQRHCHGDIRWASLPRC